MSQIMNHREIEYYTVQFWNKKHMKQQDCMYDMISEISGAENFFRWVEETADEVFQEDLVMDYGKDCLRCYLLFEKTPVAYDPYFDTWDEGALEGIYKFVSKYRRMVQFSLEANLTGMYQNYDCNPLLAIAEEIKGDLFPCFQKDNTLANRHTVLSILMEGFKKMQKELRINELAVQKHEHEIATAVPNSAKQIAVEQEKSFSLENESIFELCRNIVVLAAPFMPYISEELWQLIAIYEKAKGIESVNEQKEWYKRQAASVFQEKWYMDAIKANHVMEIPLQVNAKTKKVMKVSDALTKEEIIALAEKELSKNLEEVHYRVIYIEGKLINFVVE